MQQSSGTPNWNLALFLKDWYRKAKPATSSGSVPVAGEDDLLPRAFVCTLELRADSAGDVNV